MNQTIRIEGIPPNLNITRNLHHFKSNKEKKEWENIVAYCVRSQSIYPVRRIRQTYEFYFKDKRRHDPDNYSACAKWINDGLVSAGIIPDDNFDHIETLTVRQGGFSKKPYILVHLEEVG